MAFGFDFSKLELIEKINVGAIEAAASGLAKAGSGIGHVGSHLVSTWNGLQSNYVAPEQGKLLGAMKPIEAQTDKLGTQTGQVAAALRGYASEMAALKTRLHALKAQAAVMTAAHEADKDWEKKQSNIDLYNALNHQIEVLSVEAANVAAKYANQINAQYGGVQHRQGRYGEKGPGIYGLQLNTLPADAGWGPPLHRDKPWWEDAWDGVFHTGGSFLSGLGKDGLWNDVKGLGGLTGFGGNPKDYWDFSWGHLGKTWKGFGTYALSSNPMTWPMVLITPSLRKAALDGQKNMFKSMTAWGTWKKDPSRALGNVVYNGITLAIPEAKIGTAAKAGAALKATEAANRALRVAGMANKLDVVGHGFDLAGRGVSKGIRGIGGLTSGLRKTPDIDLNLGGLEHDPHAPVSPRIHLSDSDPDGLGTGIRRTPHLNPTPHGAGRDLPTHENLPSTTRKPTVAEVHKQVKEILDKHRVELAPHFDKLDHRLGTPKVTKHTQLHVKPKEPAFAGPHDHPPAGIKAHADDPPAGSGRSVSGGPATHTHGSGTGGASETTHRPGRGHPGGGSPGHPEHAPTEHRPASPGDGSGSPGAPSGEGPAHGTPWKWKYPEYKSPNYIRGLIGNHLSQELAHMRGHRVVADEVGFNKPGKTMKDAAKGDHLVLVVENGEHHIVEVKTGGARLSKAQDIHYPNIPKGGLEVVNDRAAAEGLGKGIILRPGRIPEVRVERWNIDSMPLELKEKLTEHTVEDIASGRVGVTERQQLIDWMRRPGSLSVEKVWRYEDGIIKTDEETRSIIEKRVRAPLDGPSPSTH